ncbi:carboxypeptidase-like regulatory domain-containing protein [Ancylomarina sp. 16SWW S1-10-2]|uniref:carboxypeptidase-like regulatory domain-containing protein n=1 Tax=Ancylomarina sp. 16SWW S1-10-2 TaxID=2499681 RepID=UPI0012AE369D|nr:carboxypeptidase-like regulatory domain-containing protein [Ancylomarina sp. 16SWW S1-10-2]MRT92324.1 carboxypeptidase-like regulatory domain-containing protein [Ancylomarina sp. 16SWW S1-10-2]
MNKAIFNTAFLLLISLTVTQAQVQINSRIIDQKSKAPISYANISIAKTTKGTMSNKDGQFELFVENPQADTRIQISSLGYQSLLLNIDEITNAKTIELKAIAYDLSEVKVNASRLMSDPKKILKACMKAAPSFRPDKPYINKGFLRQSHLLNKKYVKLIEAALFTYATPEEPKLKVHILEKRNTYDNREIDAEALGFFKNWEHMRQNKAHRQAKTYKPNKEELQKLIRETDEKRNSISKLRRLETAYQPKLGDMWHSLHDLYKSDFHQFKLDTILDLNGEAIYKIKMLPTAKELKNGIFIRLGYLLISAKDFALYEIKYGKVQNPNKNGLMITGFANTFKSNFTLKYKRQKGKLYPSYYKIFKRDFTGISSSIIEGQIKQKKYPRISKELLFTEIIEEPNQITQMLPEKWNDKLYIPSEYHPEFWKNYSILLETKNEAKLREDLESDIDMKQQFSKSADSIRINQVNN